MKYLLKVLNGTHIQGRRKYGPGDRIESDRPLHEIFNNKFELLTNLDDEGAPVITAPEPEPVINYELDDLGRGWFNVVNTETRAAINARKLREEEAKELLASLSDTEGE